MVIECFEGKPEDTEAIAKITDTLNFLLSVGDIDIAADLVYTLIREIEEQAASRQAA